MTRRTASTSRFPRVRTRLRRDRRVTGRLDAGYREAVAQLWKHVLSRAGPKEMGGIRMSGASLARLVEKWTDHMNVPISSYKANSAEELLGHIMSPPTRTRARERTRY